MITGTPGPSAAALVLVLLMAPGSAPAQGTPGMVYSPTGEMIRQGDSLHESLEPAGALEVLQRALESEPESYPALWRAAREAVSLGMLAPEGDAQKERYRQAESFAREAVKVTPDDPEGHHWLSVALGRRALLEGIRTRLKLAEEVRREAQTVLELDSLHAGGHHVLGQWNAEVMRLSGVSRFVARHVLGAGALDQASWDEAVRHLKEATRLAPESLIHHLELARVYLDMGRKEEARAELREVLERPALEPTDPLHKQEAARLMEKLR